ncbi:UDP-N-acetylmuramoyl-L-alanyl-D-glutamate--2,6-diaminopimelate ligase [Christensenella intestinihominis]|uniref:UDP-N-acetylmuramoyl-L-alanyl-D-glutamate--2, 6-diaminopimelate ligase n=1 Tax=Christensenella intestinihominis TaxID=1851429 RepID=UPI000831471A|nr:UDP-N-acetylmuramoyl-L-alanyl-D-glutamate--2,6-diaminopimelate ligase [Christensenella intestinihominis]
MTLNELFRDIACELYGDGETEIKDLKYDSRKVRKGDLFFCISGFSEDGHKYAPDAAKKGAAALVVTEYQEGIDVPQVVVKNDRETMALAACRFFDYPARRMKMIGVTGTNGKTTTTYMLKAIAEQADMKVGLIGTIRNMVGDKVIHTERTTPESVDLQRLLKEMADDGCEVLAMEVSSHSLVLKRVYGIDFDIGIFTNLTQDHLDFHETWDNYIQAKSMLFEQSEISVINIDDDSAANMMGAAKREVVKYSVLQPIQYAAKELELTHEKTKFSVEIDGRDLHIEVPIPGYFTVYNAMAAIVAANAAGIDSYCIEQGLKNMKPVAGRFEPLNTHGHEFSIILDYAHTPDSLKNALDTAKSFAPARVVTIFGCGGNRDSGKRAIMGEIAGERSDFTIITSDNPRFEEPVAIMAQIEEGIKKTDGKYICIENRREAIEYAIRNAQKDDVILLAGKGHEDYQEIKGVKHDFDEKVIVEEIMNRLGPVRK